MKVFHCDHCGNLAFFENVACVACGHTLAYLPDLGVVASLERTGADAAGADLFTTPIPRAEGRQYRLCGNSPKGVCNWAVPAGDPNPLCLSCRLTRTIPDQSVPGNARAWAVIESAKRRMVYTLIGLELPVRDKVADPAGGLAFDFLADVPGTPAMTGHDDGVIVLNIAEADDAERERRRVALHEPYRTLLGHFRHEVGHYYWDRLVQDGPRLAQFRKLFGDERQDYAAALKRNYDTGPPADWQQRHVSSYASVHPWEDWAETWAHYLHMVDLLETAADCGLSLRPKRSADPKLKAAPDPVATDSPFDAMIAGWYPLTYMLNNLNRGMGLPDGYPFVLSVPAVAKLRFVHDTVAAKGGQAGSASHRSGAGTPPLVGGRSIAEQPGGESSLPPNDSPPGR